MKKLILFGGGVLMLVLGGGGFFFLSSEADLSTVSAKEVEKPPHFWMQDEFGSIIAIAVPIDNEIALVLDKFIGKQDLYRGKSLLEVSLRDFDAGTAYMRMPYWETQLPVFSEVLPIVGGSVYWISESGVIEGAVDRVVGDKGLLSPVVLSGKVDLSVTGSPVFNEKGVIYGVITHGDATLGELYMTRIDRILSYFEAGREE